MGKNYQGTFGTGDSTTPFVPYAIQSLIDNVVDITRTSLNILAKKADGSLWGRGWHNYINYPAYLRSYVPEKLINYVDIAPYGKDDSHYLTINGVRAGWGSAVDGSLGTGNRTELNRIGWLIEPTGYDFSATEENSTTNETIVVESTQNSSMLTVTENQSFTNSTTQTTEQQNTNGEVLIVEQTTTVQSSTSISVYEGSDSVVYVVENSDGSVTLTNTPPVYENSTYKPPMLN